MWRCLGHPDLAVVVSTTNHKVDYEGHDADGNDHKHREPLIEADVQDDGVSNRSSGDCSNNHVTDAHG